jgi:hypothetical protein
MFRYNIVDFPAWNKFHGKLLLEENLTRPIAEKKVMQDAEKEVWWFYEFETHGHLINFIQEIPAVYIKYIIRPMQNTIDYWLNKQ